VDRQWDKRRWGCSIDSDGDGDNVVGVGGGGGGGSGRLEWIWVWGGYMSIRSTKMRSTVIAIGVNHQGFSFLCVFLSVCSCSLILIFGAGTQRRVRDLRLDLTETRRLCK